LTPPSGSAILGAQRTTQPPQCAICFLDRDGALISNVAFRPGQGDGRWVSSTVRLLPYEPLLSQPDVGLPNLNRNQPSPLHLRATGLAPILKESLLQSLDYFGEDLFGEGGGGANEPSIDSADGRIFDVSIDSENVLVQERKLRDLVRAELARDPLPYGVTALARLIDGGPGTGLPTARNPALPVATNAVRIIPSQNPFAQNPAPPPAANPGAPSPPPPAGAIDLIFSRTLASEPDVIRIPPDAAFVQFEYVGGGAVTSAGVSLREFPLPPPT
jgi:hypothetical protein